MKVKLKNYRDLSIIEFNDHNLIIANDSSASIGSKKYDIVKTEPEIVGYYGAQVVLIEILAYGADPIFLINNLCVEMNPTGKKIIDGIKKAIIEIGMNPDKIISGSTEENFLTVQTGMGITAIGYCKDKKIPIHMAEKKDLLVIIGLPFVGEEVLQNEDKIMNAKKVKFLRKLPYIKDILPVGSSGIRKEIENLENSADSSIILFNTDIDLQKSSGPSTSVIASLDYKFFDKLKEDINLPLNPIALL